MVSATVVEATRYGVNVKDTSGRVIKVRRADLSDPAAPHGINLDEAEDIAEQLGYITGTWRWNDAGFYKAVATSEEQYLARNPPRPPPPPMTAEANMRVFGNEEGRRFTTKELNARSKQVRLTGSTRGWEKLL